MEKNYIYNKKKKKTVEKRITKISKQIFFNLRKGAIR